MVNHQICHRHHHCQWLHLDFCNRLLKRQANIMNWRIKNNVITLKANILIYFVRAKNKYVPFSILVFSWIWQWILLFTWIQYFTFVRLVWFFISYSLRNLAGSWTSWLLKTKIILNTEHIHHLTTFGKFRYKVKQKLYSVCMVPTLFRLIINRTCSWSFRGQLWRSENFYLALAYDVCLWTSNLAEKLRYFHLNHNSNKILKSDRLSTVRISPLTRQCNRTVCIMPK